MNLALYVFFALATVLLIALGPVSLAPALAIAWSSWCGGVMFHKLFM